MNHKKLISISLSFAAFGMVFTLGIKHIPSILKVNAEEIDVATYYSNISSTSTGNDLKISLYNLIKGHTVYGYNSAEIAMRTTDRNWELSPDPNDKNPKMRLLYAQYNESNPQLWGTFHGSITDDGVTYGINANGGKDAIWNKEHIWAQSNGISGAAKSDLHHLMAADKKLNNSRSSFDFGNVSIKNACEDVFGNKTTNYLSGVFEPADEYKGDIARALMYMATRYYSGDGAGAKLTLQSESGSTGTMGGIEDLLLWNQQDAPDSFEVNRNGLVQTFQHNRNPYIDHPEYACRVWGNTNEKTRQICSADRYVASAPTSITLSNDSLTISVYETSQLSVTSVTPSDASNMVSWKSSNSNIATINSSGVVTGVGEGKCIITATSSYDSTVFANVSVTVNPPEPTELESISASANKTTLYVGDKAQIETSFTPNKAYPVPEFIFQTSDASIATVNSGEVSAVGEGNVTITVIAQQNGVTKDSKQINFSVLSKPAISDVLTISRSSFAATTNYDWHEWKAGDLSGEAYIYAGTKDKMQFNDSKPGKAVYNITELPEDIKSISVSASSGSKNWRLYVSDSSMGRGNIGTDLGVKSITTDGTIWEVDEGYKYFKLEYSDTGVAYLDKIDVAYESKTTPVEPPQKPSLTSIIVSNNPTKASYIVGESFDSTGLEVTANYSDGSTKIVELKDLTIDALQEHSTFGVSAGKAIITISFTDGEITKTATLEVVVNESTTIDDSGDPDPNSVETTEPTTPINQDDSTESDTPTNTDEPSEPTPTTPDQPSGDDGKTNNSSNGCGGSIVTTSIILSSISLIGFCLLTFRRKRRYNK